MLPWAMGYSPYDTSHVLAQLQLLFFRRWHLPGSGCPVFTRLSLNPSTFDVEWVYAPPGTENPSSMLVMVAPLYTVMQNRLARLRDWG